MHVAICCVHRCFTSIGFEGTRHGSEVTNIRMALRLLNEQKLLAASLCMLTLHRTEVARGGVGLLLVLGRLHLAPSVRIAAGYWPKLTLVPM